MMENLKKYLEDNYIPYTVEDDFVLKINGKTYQLIEPDKNGKLIDDDMDLNAEETDYDFYIYSFGGKWYFRSSDDVSIEFNEVKYIGKSSLQTGICDIFLGVHEGFELLNGSKTAKDWVNKAKFLGITHLGICDKNTLAGVLKFQVECNNNGITPIIGESFDIIEEDLRFEVKLFVKNEEGWKNILFLNKLCNVDKVDIKLEDLITHLSGLILIVDPKSIDFENVPFDEFYYELDPAECSDNNFDEKYLNNLRKFVRSSNVKVHPVVMSDAYYLDKNQSFVKKLLNDIATKSHKLYLNQYFKSFSEYAEEIIGLFNKEDDTVYSILENAICNTKFIAEECSFNLKLGEKFLPAYKMTKEESEKYKDNEDMFWSLIEDGLTRKIPENDFQRYIDRIKNEVRVIKLGGFIDYFLILYDIISFAKREGILVGIGRGSAGGSVCSYFLDLIYLDPLEFDLLFERFLNEGRIGKSYPDIDSDFPGLRREEVKKYMEHRYGKEYVCSVGTYSLLQLRASIKDIAKQYGVSFEEVNSVTLKLDIKDKTLNDLFQKAKEYKTISTFIKNHPNVINDVSEIIGQPKSASVHACATIIFPSHKNMFQSVPVRDQNNIIVSEWEGGELEMAGYLKEDILGIKQLDKFARIIELIKIETGKHVNIYKIPYDDQEVFKYFKKGWNGDVFHFGSHGLTGYCKELKPKNLDMLIAAISLYRPGAMENNFHNEYVFRMRGEKEIDYIPGLKEVTKETYGLMIYQEQIMKAVSVIADFNLVDADSIRKAMGHHKVELLLSFKQQFINGGIKNGYEEDSLKDTWEMLAKFAGYSFNKCISGKESIYRGRNNKFDPTIEEMYKIKNDRTYAKETGHYSLYKKYNRLGYGNGFSLNKDNLLIKNKIIDIRDEGIRDSYKLKLKNGSTIISTFNHKFPTNNGMKILENIDINKDKIYFNEGYKQEDTVDRFTNKGKYDLKNPLVKSYELNSEKGVKGFVKKGKTSYKSFKEYSTKWKKTYCENCNCISDRLEIHHIDGNHLNNDMTNLITLCSSCHKKAHYKLGRTKMGEKGLNTSLQEIEYIKFNGREHVYDVEMEAPYHTFALRSGIVTCNSHAAAYAITGYISQWFKVHYPMQYWMAAFEFAEEKKIPEFISEIYHTGGIRIIGSDINNSYLELRANYQSKKLFWSLLTIKMVGEKAVQQIVDDKEKNGDYFDFEEFYVRNKFKGSKVNKRVIENLILSGAFDGIERISEARGRYRLIEKYRELSRAKIDSDKDLFELNTNRLEQNSWWQVQQKLVSSLAFLDYEHLCSNMLKFGTYIDSEDFNSMDGKTQAKIGGFVVDIIEKRNKKGKWCSLVLESNYTFINVTIWSDIYDMLKTKLKGCKKKCILISGIINYDRYKKCNTLYGNKKSEVIIL